MEERTCPALSFHQTVRAVTEFIEAAIHTILCVRHVYPAQVFQRRKKYEAPVYQSRHPALNNYISGAMKAIAEEMLIGTVEKVVVVIKDQKDLALERFVFSVRMMLQVEMGNEHQVIEDSMDSAMLAQYFRTFLIKLNTMEAQLGVLSDQEHLTFSIVIELRDEKVPSQPEQNKDPPPWIPAVLQHTTAGATDNAELHMIRSVETGIVNVSLVVQESEEKLNRMKESRSKLKGKGKTD